MKKLFRNQEVRKPVLWGCCITAVFSAAAFCLDIRCGVLVLLLGITLTALFLSSTAARYRKLKLLVSYIDRILHDEAPQVPLSQYEEGELCILQNELTKMIVRLREQQSALMAEKNHLSDSLADISHQIRTPLTTTTLLVQSLRKPGLQEEERLARTRELLGLLSRIDWLIVTLLKISKLDAGSIQFNHQKVSLESLLRDAAEPLQIPVELRGQTLTFEAQGFFYGDPQWTKEAISNIIKNCMEHTPDGGTITLSGTDNALYTEIVIADSGSGIPKEDLPHIFERFYKGKNSNENSFGIGLNLARIIVTGQDGIIKAENRGGAVFTMRFMKSTV